MDLFVPSLPYNMEGSIKYHLLGERTLYAPARLSKVKVDPALYVAHVTEILSIVVLK